MKVLLNQNLSLLQITVNVVSCRNNQYLVDEQVMVALVSSAAAAAASMAELGKNGNSHARWNRICGRFQTFCDHTGGALIASFISVGLLMALNALSTINLYKKQAHHY